MPPFPLIRVIKLHSVGTDVKAVKMALRAAGESGFNNSATFGPYVAMALARYQKRHNLTVDAEYGPQTHVSLWQYFDSTARKLYEHTRPDHTLELPEFFVSTHMTLGLNGYPAIDCFAPAGTRVTTPCAGEIYKHSGHAPSGHLQPSEYHGPYGYSQYLENHRGDKFFMTHFAILETTVGQNVKAGDVIGTVVDFMKATHGDTQNHIHMGKHSINGSTTH